MPNTADETSEHSVPNEPESGADSGGWVTESHSEPSTPVPDDTTIEPVSHEAADRARSEIATRKVTGPEQAKPDQAIPDAKPKKRDVPDKDSFQARINQFRRETTAAQQKAQDLERKNEELVRQIEAAKRGVPPSERPAPVEAKRESTPAISTEIPDIPEHPQYVNFETDADYKAAVVDWQKKMRARDEALEARRDAAIDARLNQQRQEEFNTRRQAAFEARKEAVIRSDPEYTEKVEAASSILKEITREKSLFIFDIVENTEDGVQLLHSFADDPDMASALASLPVPSAGLADAVRSSPAAVAIMQYFATDEGRQDFMRLRSLPPLTVSPQVAIEIGRLTARLESATRGPDPDVVHPITHAVPSTKPLVGTPRARDTRKPEQVESIEDYVAAEREAEIAERRRRFGLPA